MEDTEKEKKDDLINSEGKEDNSPNKKITFIIIACFIFSVALVILAIIIYLAKDKSLAELEVYTKYDKIEEIKIGGIGKVYKATDKKTNETFSIREIKLNTKEIREDVQNDIKFMNASTHASKRTFQLKEVFEQRSTKFIVTEYYDEDLSITLDKTEKGFDIDRIKKIMNQINISLQNFRKLNVVYNNMLLENIIVQKHGENYTYKLSNFSKSILITNNKDETEKEDEWGIKPVLGNINEKKKDLYDIGKEIYRMIFKEQDKKDDEMIKNINEKCNDTELNDLMEKLLVEKDEDRISWEDYFNHTFFVS